MMSIGKKLEAVDDPSHAISPAFLFQVLSLSSVVPTLPPYAPCMPPITHRYSLWLV